MGVVVDASLLAAVALTEPQSETVSEALQRWSDSGDELHAPALLPFEVASLVLTVGVIGAIVLAMPERLGKRIARRRGTISLGHARGVDMALPEGVRGESPIENLDGELATGRASGRGLIMVTDPDEYTTVGRRR